jgi:hypothetical protein
MTEKIEQYIQDLEFIWKHLFWILDNIDTASDIAKWNMEIYEKLVLSEIDKFKSLRKEVIWLDELFKNE